MLLSIDPIATDMMQGRCFGQCLRDDNDYPVAWIRQHGKARVFYTSLGHNPDVFWDPRMLAMFLAGIQYALGDLDADATPRPRGTSQFDTALAAMTKYDFGQDRAQVRRFEREVSLAAATKEGAADAEQKMLKVLQSQAPLGAKDAICRQLAIIGSSRSEPVLKADAEEQEHRGHGALRAARAAGEMKSIRAKRTSDATVALCDAQAERNDMGRRQWTVATERWRRRSAPESEGAVETPPVQSVERALSLLEAVAGSAEPVPLARLDGDPRHRPEQRLPPGQYAEAPRLPRQPQRTEALCARAGRLAAVA